MRFPPLVVLVAIALLAPPTQANEPMKVMTFNIRYDGRFSSPRAGELPWVASDGASRRDMVRQIVVDEDPDLLALQEALDHQVQEIHAVLPEHSVYTVGRDDGKATGEHCSIFYRTSRFDEVDAGTFWLCATPDEPGSKFPDAACPRVASWVHLRDRHAGGEDFVLVNTHWDHTSQAAREFAANAIMEKLTEIAPDGQAIVVGDMNAASSSPELARLVDGEPDSLIDAYRAVHPDQLPDEATFNGFKNRTTGARIDYVLHSRHFFPTSARIVRTTFDGQNASDHFPVVVELQ